MMSPKKAKDHCGYTPTPVLPVCANCRAFALDLVAPSWVSKALSEKGFVQIYPKGRESFEITSIDQVPDDYKVESGLRCLDHGFAVKKMASCRLWHPKKPDGEEA